MSELEAVRRPTQRKTDRPEGPRPSCVQCGAPDPVRVYYCAACWRALEVDFDELRLRRDGARERARGHVLRSVRARLDSGP